MLELRYTSAFKLRNLVAGSRGSDPQVHREQPGEAARAQAGARGEREGLEGGRGQEEAGAARGRQEHSVKGKVYLASTLRELRYRLTRF